MLKTLTEKHTGNDLLKEYLATHKVKIAATVDELLGPDTGESQEEIQAEVDDFLRLRAQWRKEDNDDHRRID
jgi:hypothetical protein